MTVVVEESVIGRLITQPALLVQLPSLKAALASSTKTTSSCGSCGGGRNRKSTSTVDYAKLKTTIVGLPDREKLVLKKLLNATKIRVVRRDPKGRKIVVEY